MDLGTSIGWLALDDRQRLGLVSWQSSPIRRPRSDTAHEVLALRSCRWDFVE